MSDEVLTRMVFGCTPVGDKVVTQLGEKTFTMHYRDAIKLAAFMRHAAAQAKRWAGDTSIIFTGTSTLTDANADELEAQKRRDGSIFSGRHK